MADIVMPRLSDTMEEGTILRWLKVDGEPVSRGAELVEIETDKAAMTYESDQDGVLEIVAPEGATLAVGELIARVGERSPGQAGGPAPDGPAAAPVPAQAGVEPSTDPEGRQPTPAAPPSGNGQGDLAASGIGSPAPPPTPTPSSTSAPAPAATPAPTAASAPAPADGARGEHAGEGRVKASPLARRMARESGVDLSGVSGSGPGGRIVKADVVGAGTGGSATAAPAQPAPVGGSAAAPAAPAAPAAASPPAAAGDAPPSQAEVLAAVATAKGETTEVELNRTQATIARRMAESKATIPEFTLVVDVDMEGCVALREELKRLAGRGGAGAQSVATYNDMVVKAAAVALREYPRANGSYRDGRVQLHSRVNVGVAVAAMDALIVPTVFDADEKSLGEVARETRRLIERVRDGTISPPELSGGTFTVSNLGMYGIRNFTAIINPPQVAILSVGSLEPRAVSHEGELRMRHTMSLTLACDHRVLYGADAAQFLARIRELLQTPSALSL
jgi:pyruvate dehydrogenase E2 component (dihydrolipoamide acetyltransferase)